MSSAPVDFLYTNIGRGHPHYLDGIVEVLDPSRVGRVHDVFEISWGVGRLGWHLARSLYRSGPSRAGFDPIYNRIRRNADFDRPGFMLKAMGGAVRSTHMHGTHPLIVAHPMLVGILKKRRNLIYQHGEIAVPDDAVVNGEHTILVPDSGAADCFMKAGLSSDQLVVTGLCIENDIVDQAETCFGPRLQRLEQAEALTGAFFSSGAEPRRHVEVITRASFAAAREGHRVLIFARRGGRLERHAISAFEHGGIPLAERTRSYAIENATLCLYADRHELNALTSALFAHFDFFMAPSYERTCWALGLGLPMFLAEPAIGSFAPLNRQRLLTEGVAQSIGLDEAAQFGASIHGMAADGKLVRMAKAGRRRDECGGFRKISEWLSQNR